MSSQPSKNISGIEDEADTRASARLAVAVQPVRTIEFVWA